MFYYIITVGINPIHSSKAGKLYLDNFLEYTDCDIENTKLADQEINNELFYTPKEIALQNHDMKKFSNAIGMIKLRMVHQQTISYKIMTEFKMDRRDLETYIENSTKEDIEKFRINL